MSVEKEEVVDSPDVYFEPLVRLPHVDVKTLEENEIQLLKLRAKLYRFDSTADPAEWKERGVGDVKLLQNNDTGIVRVLMRRDKTLKICANHFILSHMELKPNCGSDRAWVWSTPADFADEECKSELLAIRFANADHARQFKEKFDTATATVPQIENGKCNQSIDSNTTKSDDDEDDDDNNEDNDSDTENVVDKLTALTVKEESAQGDHVKSTNDDDKTSDNTALSTDSTSTNGELAKKS